jgi:hypothetical protein
MAGFWDKALCCCQEPGCSTHFTGYCFQFSVAGVMNAPPLYPWEDFPPCSSCADYNGTWLLVPMGPIDPEADTCTWATCRPPGCGPYPTPVGSLGPAYRFTMNPVDTNKDVLLGFEISGGGATYRLNSPDLSLSSPNIFTLRSDGNGAECAGWPATISVMAIRPLATGSQTRTAQTFTTVGNEPHEANPVVNGPGLYSWQPSAGPFAPNAGLITPNPYIDNSNRAITDWLICQNFGFDIPGNYWVTGISIQFKRWTDQRNAAFDDWVTVGLNYVIGSPDGPTGSNEAQSGAWPLFSAQPGADLATYGGQYDDWRQGGYMQTFINSPDWCFAIGANLIGMTQGSA